MPGLDRTGLDVVDWAGVSVIDTDYLHRIPKFNTVGVDWHCAMAMALEGIRAADYTRPGLVLNSSLESRLLRRQVSAYEAGAVELFPSLDRPFSWIANGRERFSDWFTACECDVILADDPLVTQWMSDVGAVVSVTHGFCCIRSTDAIMPCAGLDLRPQAVGACGMELLTGQVMRNGNGIPDRPCCLMVSPRWIDRQSLASSVVIADHSLVRNFPETQLVA
jgi:hypothetical protein